MKPGPAFPDADATVEPLLVVADMTRTLAFWVDQIGASVEVHWDSYALLRIGAGRVHVAVTGEPPPDRDVRLVPPAREGDASAEVVIGVGDCRAVVATLEQRGVSFLGPPVVPAWGGEVRAFLRDPDGHLIEITSAG